MRGIEGDMLRGHLDTMILASLENDEAHGLEILRRLEGHRLSRLDAAHAGGGVKRAGGTYGEETA